MKRWPSSESAWRDHLRSTRASLISALQHPDPALRAAARDLVAELHRTAPGYEAVAARQERRQNDGRGAPGALAPFRDREGP